MKRCLNPTPVPSISALTVAAYVIAGGLHLLQWHDLDTKFYENLPVIQKLLNRHRNENSIYSWNNTPASHSGDLEIHGSPFWICVG
jgi:hypothetical protein